MQQTARNRWRNVGWIAFAAIALVLLVAGVYKKNHKACTGIEVVFDGDGNNFFIDEKGVVALLKANGIEPGIEINKINLRSLEEMLKKDQWISNAELFFDNKQVLKAMISEKEPVARLFTASGSSFYIDSTCRRLPLSQKLSARIPMFTSFPSDGELLSKPDSELLVQARDLALFIHRDDFWKAQVAQIDITTEGFEMIPTIGNHIVALGRDGNYADKFNRLYSFYKQVWKKVGFETYERLDVRFSGQVVATLKGARATAVIDSAKARQAIADMESKERTDTAEEAAPAVVSKPAKDTAVKAVVKPAAAKVVARPAAVMPKPVVALAKPAAKGILPKADKKAMQAKKPATKTLTSEEERIRREAMKSAHAAHATAPKQKAVVKPKNNNKRN